MNTNRLTFYIRRAIYIFSAWVIFAITVFIYDYITLKSNGSLPQDYNFTSAFTAYLIVALCAAIIGGTITVNLIEYWLRKYRFWVVLLLIIVVYTFVSLGIGAIGMLYINGPEQGLPMFRQESLSNLGGFYKKPIFLKNYVIWLVLLLLTLIFLLVNDRFGPGVFSDYLKGKYFHPKKEERIFMFSDIKGATTIAERLGETKYFQFLKDFFKYISPAITEYKGEVYQYVGDEIVLSWKVKENQNSNALECYYRMNDLIQQKATYFQDTYGFLPNFKSGIHTGMAVVGEIGVIKRDIAFSGDVLNTAARIQAKCNDLGVTILASEAYLQSILPISEKFEIIPIGEQVLKGKVSEVKLVSFRNKI